MHAPFTAADVAAHCRRLKGRKAVAGSVPPWYLKEAGTQLAHVLAATFNAWVRIGQLPAADALSIINPIPKPGAQPGSLDGLRGIAVGTLPAKLFACILEQRVSDWAEASGSRAAGSLAFGDGAAQRRRRWSCVPCKTCTAATARSCGHASLTSRRPTTACPAPGCGPSCGQAASAAAGCGRCRRCMPTCPCRCAPPRGCPPASRPASA